MAGLIFDKEQIEKTMDAIVERLGGYISRNSEDGAFTTEILLPAL